MGLEALAEGVETGTTAGDALGLGCSFMQGFGIGKPMPLHDTFAWLAARETMGPPPRADMPEAETAPLSEIGFGRPARAFSAASARDGVAQNAP
jgi:hypothetical protein